MCVCVGGGGGEEEDETYLRCLLDATHCLPGWSQAIVRGPWPLPAAAHRWVDGVGGWVGEMFTQAGGVNRIEEYSIKATHPPTHPPSFPSSYLLP